MRTFLFLNFWTFILDFIIILLLMTGLFGLNILLIQILTGIIALVLLFKAIELHSTVNRKYRARSVLIEKNRNVFKDDSFEQFMGAPCGRMLVRDVLIVLDRQSEYKLLKSKYYNGFFSSKSESGLVIIPHSQKEHIDQ